MSSQGKIAHFFPRFSLFPSSLTTGNVCVTLPPFAHWIGSLLSNGIHAKPFFFPLGCPLDHLRREHFDPTLQNFIQPRWIIFFLTDESNHFPRLLPCHEAWKAACDWNISVTILQCCCQFIGVLFPCTPRLLTVEKGKEFESLSIIFSWSLPPPPKLKRRLIVAKELSPCITMC